MSDPLGSIYDWDEDGVCLFFSNLGYPQFDESIRDNRITGDLLVTMNAEDFKELGLSVGQRLAILKAVYLVKLAHDIPIGEDDYVPPSEVAERHDETSLEKLHEVLKGHADRLLKVEEENRILRTTLNSALEDLNRRVAQGEESPLARSKSFKWPDFIKPHSPTKTEATLNSPQPSPRRAEMDPRSNRHTGMTDTTRMSTTSTAVDHSTPTAKPARQESSDNLKSFKVSLEDPAWKVLPAALKKYKINNDDWQNYAMFICFGSSNNRVERCLSYDEKPLLLFQKLKDAKKNPVFMLKHIKDIRSPIVVAQQKHAARKASASGESLLAAANGGTPSTSSGRPPRLRVDHSSLANASTPLMTSNPLQTSWPELMSPAVETKSDGLLTADPSLRGNGDGDSATSAASGHGSSREMLPNQGVSYAVAIYPYMAEQEDEFDVVVGHTFVILSRARGWWVVQRDESGTGEIDADPSKQGWVPAGCLLETKVPVASAIAEASAKTSGSASHSSQAHDQKKQPILPLSIVSTSFPGVALMEYQGKDGDELDLVKDEPLRVFKRYNHWSYAVKEETGDRGWVPSWYIGKVAQDPKIPPASPTVAGMQGELETMIAAQPSPMSTAFPSRVAVS